MAVAVTAALFLIKSAWMPRGEVMSSVPLGLPLTTICIKLNRQLIVLTFFFRKSFPLWGLSIYLRRHEYLPRDGEEPF